MLEQAREIRPDRRPAIIICAYDAEDDAWDPVEDLSGTPWSPAGARTVPVPAGPPEDLAAVLSDHLRSNECRALLLVGRSRHNAAFRVQMRAENRAPSGGRRLTETGPAMARTTAPVAEMVRALNAAGLSASATSEGEDDVGSFLLYSVLTSLADGVDTPAIGLLRVPADAAPAALRNGVKAAAAAIARHLSPLPRSRPT